MTDFPPPPPPPPPPPDGPPPGYEVYGAATGARGEHAGFWIRLAAALVDGIIYGIPTSIAGSIMGLDVAGQQLFGLIVGLVYFTVQEGSTGQTIGKKLCGIRVVDAATGGGIDPGRAAVRYLVSIVSGLACTLGYLWMLWDENKQCWHDKASQVVVLKA